MPDTNYDAQPIDPAASWADVPQLSTQALLFGGPDGPLNAQAIALAARTKHLDETKGSSADVQAAVNAAGAAVETANAAQEAADAVADTANDADQKATEAKEFVIALEGADGVARIGFAEGKTLKQQLTGMVSDISDRVPKFAANAIPTTNVGAIDVIGVGRMEWSTQFNRYVADALFGIGAGSDDNWLINSSFNILERGTATWSGVANQVGPDNWILNTTAANGTPTMNVLGRGSHGMPGVENIIRVVSPGTTAAGGVVLLQQHIENGVADIQGKVAISFKARCVLGGWVSVELVQNFGLGGAPSSPVTGIGATKIYLPPSTDMRTYVIEDITLPSITGKTFGNNQLGGLNFYLWISAGSTYNDRSASLGSQAQTVDITDLKVVNNSRISAYRRRPISEDIHRCKRYFQRVFASVRGYSNGAGYVFWAPVAFQNMRTSPAVTYMSAESVNGMASVTYQPMSNNSGYFGGTTTMAGDCYAHRHQYALDATI